MLRLTFPGNLQRTLSELELPRSLDETFEWIFMGIRKSDRDLAHRLLQCLFVAARPLHIEELAEIGAIDFDGAEEGTPRLVKGRRSENLQKDVLSICSSLIMVVDTGHSRVVQFSHFSVKEAFGRLANAPGDISRFHIIPESAHTTLTQACLATLLGLHDSSSNDQVERNFPLAGYASQHWVDHARSGMVSSRIEAGMRRLFDSTGPYFATWLRLYNIDDHWNGFGNAWVARGSPLYYASLCGFRDLAEHIINVSPEQINATGGRRHSPLAAALCKAHFHVAELLLQHGASVDVTDYNNQTLLQAASAEGRSDAVRWLVDHGADMHSQRNDHVTLIHLAAANGHSEVIQTLLKYGVDIDSADNDGKTALHLASSSGKVEIVRLLLEHGADANLEDNDGYNPLSLTWTTEIERLLLDHGASPQQAREQC